MEMLIISQILMKFERSKCI